MAVQPLSYVSLFAGIGGFELGISRAAPSACLGFSEIDTHALRIYRRQFPDHKNFGDITKIEAASLPDFELLCGGFPCQAFSIAGRRRGLSDARGVLFFDMVRIAAAKRPRLLLLENVKGLLSHDQGSTFSAIIKAFDELGYDLQWQVLNSKDFGVPQNRERVFIVGHLRGTPRPEVFPLATGGGASDEVPHSTQRPARVSGNREISHGPTAHRRAMRHPLKFAKRNQRNIEGDYAYTVDGCATGGIYQDAKLRRLTPLECERLQGFPDGWTDGIGDRQRYKCLGNAVTVNVIAAIAAKLAAQKNRKEPHLLARLLWV